MTTTTKTADYMGRALVTPDTDARDYLNLPTIAGDRDYMGRSLTGGSEEPDPQALLDEAAYRFDYSEYGSVAEIVDLNNGWTGFVDQSSNATPVFGAAGLSYTSTGGSPNGRIWLIGVEGPLSFNAVGLTLLQVGDVDGTFNDATVMGVQIVFDDDAPDLLHHLDTRSQPSNVDELRVNFTDVAPAYHNLVYQNSFSSGHLSSLDVDGRFFSIIVLSADATEAYVRRVTPEYDFETTFAYAFTAEYPATEPPVNGIRVQGLADHTTHVEDLGWNRALTSGEVDALVAHFTA